MRIARLLVILIAAAPLSGCEESATDSSAPPTVTTRPATRTFTPSTQFLAVTQPSTRPATTTASGINRADPLATPRSAITYLFELMKNEDVNGVRAMMADPLPAEKLRGEVRAVADRFSGGAKWDIVETRDDGVVGVVIFRTTFPDG